MMVSITRCCRSWLERLLIIIVLAGAGLAHAGSIEPVHAALKPGEDGHVLSAEFSIDLGSRLEEAVARGVPLYFNLEFTLEHNRWYWLNEQVASITITYRLAYNALTRQYRLSFGGLHQSFTTLGEALRVISRVSALPVADKGVLKSGEIYAAALRLSLDRNQLPKPLQVDAIANSDWQVSSKALRWQFYQQPESVIK
ncbi:MAG: DUF4390 domain-containing protein [Sulfurisoma sp.]|nr:DUF4390 domain-containing protein [Sulfurisoma sp.]